MINGTRVLDLRPHPKTLAEVQNYIYWHEKHFNFPPFAIGLLYENYINILKECNADGRCNNLEAHIGNVKLVRL